MLGSVSAPAQPPVDKKGYLPAVLVAFLAVFSPRSEADVLPGRGHTDRLFADGGMFYNLPFLAAIEILEAGQSSWRESEKTAGTVLSRVRRRTQRRDIDIAAGLNAAPGPQSTYDTLFKNQESRQEPVSGKQSTDLPVRNRNGEGCVGTNRQDRRRILQGGRRLPGLHGECGDLEYHPTDTDHINPTFACCLSARMDPKRVQQSIADGCYRTLSAFLTNYGSEDTTLQAAFEGSNVKAVSVRQKDDATPAQCPHFSLGEHPLVCPFASDENKNVAAIRNVCKNRIRPPLICGARFSRPKTL